MSEYLAAAVDAAVMNARQLSISIPVRGNYSRRVAGRRQQGDLTRRQLEVLHLVSQGRTNREIASTLYVSPRTVEMHVGDILAHLDCHTRTEAVYKASELRLLEKQ